MLAFRVPSEVSWGCLFSVMEAMKHGQDPACSGGAKATTQEPLVEDYTASDTSLEQVFLSFAREGTDTDSDTHKIPTPQITEL